MGIFFVYIVKTSIVLALMYLCFSLLLGRETFHRVNRVALMAMVVLAFIFPFMQSHTSTLFEPETYMVSIEQLELLFETITTELPVEEETTASDTHIIATVIVVIYAIGALLTAIHYIIGVTRVVIFIRNTNKTRLENGNILCTHNKNISPFSYMKYIVVSNKDIEENRKEIITHEEAHIKLKHSFDLIFIELCCILLWFNPAIWLLKRDLKNIHEYEADETVLKSGANAKEYQLLLIKKAVGEKIYTAVNNFNHCLTKKRITMMLKQKSSKWATAKYLFVIPLMAASAVALARPEIRSTINELENVNIEQIVKTENTIKEIIQKADTASNKKIETVNMAEKMPEYPGGQKGLMSYIYDNIGELAKELKLKDNARIFVQFIVMSDGSIKGEKITGISNNKTIEGYLGEKGIEKVLNMVRNMPKWKPGRDKTGKAVNVMYTFPVSFTIKADNKKVSTAEKTILEGVMLNTTQCEFVSSNEKMPEFPGGSKELMSYLNNKAAAFAKETGMKEGGRVLVQFIVTKEGNIKDPTIVNISNKKTPEQILGEGNINKFMKIFTDMPKWTPGTDKDGNVASAKYTVPVTFALYGGETSKATTTKVENKIYIIDGEEVNESEVMSKNSKDIKSIIVLKNQEMIAKYGDKAKDGVVFINTKGGTNLTNSINGTMNSIEVSSTQENTNGKIKEDTKIFIDGKEIDKSEMQQLSAGKIKHIIVKKANKKGDSNVIVIKTNENGQEISISPMLIYIVDGKKATKEYISKLKSEDIESMSVLKGKQATDKYGEEAQNGVIIINLKKK